MPDADKFLDAFLKTISDATGMSDADAGKLENSIGGIAGAFEIWSERIKEATHALALMKLPDLSEPVSQINQLAQAQAGYARALNDTVTAYNSIEAASNRAIQRIREHTGLQKQLAKLAKLPTAGITQAGDEAELAEMERRMHELTMSAAVKKHMAEEIKVPMEAQKARRDKLGEQQQNLMTEAGKEEGEAENLRRQIPRQRQSFHEKESVQYLKEYNQTGNIQDLMGAAGMSLQAQQTLMEALRTHQLTQKAVNDQLIAMIEQNTRDLVQQHRRAESIGK